MTPTPIDIILSDLSDIKATLNDHTGRLARVETLIDERTSKAVKRRALFSKSVWTTLVSGVLATLWEARATVWAGVKTWFRSTH